MKRTSGRTCARGAKRPRVGVFTRRSFHFVRFAQSRNLMAKTNKQAVISASLYDNCPQAESAAKKGTTKKDKVMKVMRGRNLIFRWPDRVLFFGTCKSVELISMEVSLL